MRILLTLLICYSVFSQACEISSEVSEKASDLIIYLDRPQEDSGAFCTFSNEQVIQHVNTKLEHIHKPNYKITKFYPRIFDWYVKDLKSYLERAFSGKKILWTQRNRILSDYFNLPETRAKLAAILSSDASYKYIVCEKVGRKYGHFYVNYGCC